MTMTKTVACAAALAVGALSAPDAIAQGNAQWQWRAAVYAYLPDFGGSTSFPQSAPGGDLTIDAKTIVDNLKFTFMGALEGSNGRTGVFTDVVYLDLGNTKSNFRDLSLGGGALPAGVTTTASYDLKGWSWTLAGLWRLSSDATSTTDLFAGTRLLDMRQTLDVEFEGNIGPLPLPGRRVESRATLSNWDAIVGIRGRHALGEGRRWFVPYHLDVGTGESKLTWQAMAGLGYSFGWGDFIVAWRYLDYDMKSGGAIRSLDFNGPAIAAAFSW